MPAMTVEPLAGIKMVEPGDDLGAIPAQAIEDNGIALVDGDIVAIAQKIVSKAEGRQIALDSVSASSEATALAAETDKDPRLVQLILDESDEVLRKKPGVLIMRHNLGIVGAHAGVDQSNIDHGEGETALLLPVDPDASAHAIRDRLSELTGKAVGVLITDSTNRPWRMGTIGIAIGAAGFKVLDDHRGGVDMYGRELKVTLINRADSIATAATLLMGETTEKTPAALVRGFPLDPDEETADQDARMINRPLDEDLFR